MATKQLNQEVFELNWILIIWENILRLKGMTLPPTLFFRNMEELIQQVKDYTPKPDWGGRDGNEMYYFIKNQTEESLQWLFLVYLNSAFPDNREEKTVCPVGLRILFFLLVLLIKEGLLMESKEKLKGFFENNSVRGNFHGARHVTNVKELFSFIG